MKNKPCHGGSEVTKCSTTRASRVAAPELPAAQSFLGRKTPQRPGQIRNVHDRLPPLQKNVKVSMPKRSKFLCSAVLTTKWAELLFHWVTFLWWVLDVMPFNPYKALHCPIACLCHWRIILTIPEELHVRDFAQLSQLNFQPMLVTIACDRWDTCQHNTTRAQA